MEVFFIIHLIAFVIYPCKIHKRILRPITAQERWINNYLINNNYVNFQNMEKIFLLLFNSCVKVQ